MSFHYRGKKLFGIVCICTGALILLLIILPTWAWLSLAALGLIWLGWALFRKC